jgi:hypothetical protein
VEVQQRFWNFYRASRLEIDDLNANFGCSIPRPTAVIFGHTHVPVAWHSRAALRPSHAAHSDGEAVPLYNTGGWLNRLSPNRVMEFCGAEVFTFETGVGFTSTSVS